MPAEKLGELKPLLVPRKIRRPKDVLPVVAHTVSDLHRRKPVFLYAVLLAIALLAGVSYYSLKRSVSTAAPVTVAKGVPLNSTQSVAAQPSLTSNEAVRTIPAVNAENRPVLLSEPPKADAAKASRLRWNKLITATNSNYGIGLLGGIKDLSVMVNNHSDYPLNEVVVKLTYIKANGDVWKTVPITMYSVPAHESKDQPVPDVGRAKKVRVGLRSSAGK